jgi:cytochrome c peroxidase
MKTPMLSGLTLGAALLSLAAQAQPAIYKDADYKMGEQLIAENKCVACHVSKVGGDGSAIYKPQGRIANAALLRGMVEQCNTELNLGMFPEDVTSVAAVLNRDHYKFK